MATKTVLKTAERDERLGSSTLPSSAKTCRDCGVEKPLSDFYTDGYYKVRTKYKPTCRTCEMKGRKERSLQIIKSVFGDKPACLICGYDKCFAALDFHHVDPSEKEYSIAKMLLGSPAKGRLEKELRKCVVLCATCHREYHAGVVELPPTEKSGEIGSRTGLLIRGPSGPESSSLSSSAKHGTVAQLVERLPEEQRVSGSNPFSSTTF